MNDDLETTLLNLVHDNGYMAVQDALRTSVLERANSTDPYVLMTKLLKTHSLGDVVYNNFGRKSNFRSEVVDSGVDVDTDHVFKIVKINDVYYKITGYESSYSETSWVEWKVVYPKQITKTIYE